MKHVSDAGDRDDTVDEHHRDADGRWVELGAGGGKRHV